MNYYVYKLSCPETGEYYIGSRQCDCSPKDDDYMGSYKSWIPKDKSLLIKEILRDDFENREDANNYEIELIAKHIKEDLNRNYHIPPDRFFCVPKGPHPFISNKHMLEYCKKNNIECNTQDGSDVDWLDLFIKENEPVLPRTINIIIQKHNPILKQPIKINHKPKNPFTLF